MPRDGLGQFELIVALAVLRVGSDAYGVPISEEIESRLGRDVAVGSVYATLDRLESKGLLTSRMGDPTPERGGRRKRYFQVTADGLETIRETRQVLDQMWGDLPETGEPA
jgi:DNA-binding PadR family transcriptional regulator